MPQIFEIFPFFYLELGQTQMTYKIYEFMSTWTFFTYNEHVFLEKSIILIELECFLKCLNSIESIFFQFFFIFTYVSNQIWINQSDHHNVHEIPRLLSSEVVNFSERFDLILMWYVCTYYLVCKKLRKYILTPMDSCIIT